MASTVKKGAYQRLDARIWIITAIGFLNTAGFSISLPFMALYLHQQRGISMTVVGLIVLTNGLCSAGTQLFGGVISDRFGRRPLLLGAATAGLVLYSVMAVLIAVSAPVWIIVLVYALGQSVTMVARPANQAIVADVAPKNQLTQAYGLLRVGFNLGWAAGPAIGGILLISLPYMWLFGVTALTSAVTSGLVFWLVKESHAGSSEKLDARNVFSAAGDRRFLYFILLGLLVFLVMGQMVSTLSVFTVDRLGFTTAQYGMLLTTNGLIVVVFQYPVALIIGKVPKYKALILGSLLYAAGYFIMGWAGGLVLAVIAMTTVTIGEIVFSPVALSVAGALAPSDRRGRYLAFFGLSEGLGYSTASLFGGVLLDVFPTGRLSIWGIIAVLAVFGALGFLIWGKTFTASDSNQEKNAAPADNL